MAGSQLGTTPTTAITCPCRRPRIARLVPTEFRNLATLVSIALTSSKAEPGTILACLLSSAISTTQTNQLGDTVAGGAWPVATHLGTLSGLQHASIITRTLSLDQYNGYGLCSLHLVTFNTTPSSSPLRLHAFRSAYDNCDIDRQWPSSDFNSLHFRLRIIPNCHKLLLLGTNGPTETFGFLAKTTVRYPPLSVDDYTKVILYPLHPKETTGAFKDPALILSFFFAEFRVKRVKTAVRRFNTTNESVQCCNHVCIETAMSPRKKHRQD
ncbi:hypothetical protein MBM_07920 [Drepanopeziza brunnea f. sp. 'multigermtubi' MB_m1]|uniref:Uncharacterized protein n=2 Tax=Drepanopeziza brunnea f. sp. 'multigermtubi' TaxID=698441 RepID=K1XMN6_MARBU|nr:uncharacterized protein MBM_07920 [Drepanopeziza brunnea f. sp. 'multigermtubi' MB_m1]EKD13719.1 hypothetical protein MBM_07920 [Drepanopeziza brunnea f. sp. 'multigermtubi' MB_m1]